MKILILILLFLPVFANARTIKDLEVNSIKFSVEVVSTEMERNLGLMYRENLPKNTGMFFVFDKEEKLAFWMKNTKIPLDIVFMDKNYKIVHIHKNAKPMSLEPIKSRYNAKFVLEINAGESDKFNNGDLIIIK